MSMVRSGTRLRGRCVPVNFDVWVRRKRVKLSTLLENIGLKHRYTTTDDLRHTFGDHHNALQWLAAFLLGDDEGSDRYIIDASTLADTQTPDFHDWLVHWAARATLRRALETKRKQIAELAAEYDRNEPVDCKHDPLSPQQFRILIRNSEAIRERLDVLCRFVLVIRGIGKEPPDEVAAQLAIGTGAVERAYCVALESVNAADAAREEADPCARPASLTSTPQW
jgi:hypothetical protein